MLSIFGSIHPPVFFSLEPGKQPKCSNELSRESRLVLYPASLAWYAKGKPTIFPLRIQQIINKKKIQFKGQKTKLYYLQKMHS